MLWLFVIAFAAWTAYRIAARTEFEASPLVARVSVIVAGAAFLWLAALFATGPWWPPLEFASGMGLAALFVLAFNLFWLLGPIGNALLWGALGVWCLKKAWDGGWYRGALLMRRDL